MVKKILIESKQNLKIVIYCIIGLILLNYLTKYCITNYKPFNSFVNVTSNYLIDDKYELSLEHHLIYKDIYTYPNNIHFSMSYIFNDRNRIIKGREPKNKFEIMVSNKDEVLYNHVISIKIGKERYNFKVVGIYDGNNLPKNPIYTNMQTMKFIFELLNDNYKIYNYMFIVDDYKKLNSNLDILTDAGYKVVIKNSDSFVRLNNYTTLIDFLTLLKFVLLIIIFLCILSISF